MPVRLNILNSECVLILNGESICNKTKANHKVGLRSPYYNLMFLISA